MASSNINIVNKRASFEYIFLEKFIAGIQLMGTEIKSIRQGKANITEAYCIFKKGELWVKNMHISEYTKGTHYNHEPLRMRKLLLTARELKRLQTKVKERGLTIIVHRLFLSERGFAKLEIALAKGKKIHDKRQSIKEKDLKREVGRNRRWKI